MNNLTTEQLMRIIVDLDTSYKKQLAKKNLQLTCSASLLYENDAEENQRVEMVDFDKCYLCKDIIVDYKYWDIDDDESQEFVQNVENIFTCDVCNRRTCGDCEWAQCCRNCFEVRKKAIECKEIIAKIDNISI